MKLKPIVFVLVVAFLLASLKLYAMPNLFLADADASGGELTWGGICVIQSYQIVANNHEILVGHYGYVFSSQTPGDKDIPNMDWGRLVSGNLQSLRDQIEHDIPGSSVVWIHVSWQKAEYFELPHNPDSVNYQFFHVSGFLVEAIVENVNAGMTGIEIVAIIMALAFLATIIALISLGGWITWEIINAIKDLGKLFPGWGSVIMIIIGLLILGGIGFLIFVLFGGRVKKSKRGFEIGKAQYFSFGETS